MRGRGSIADLLKSRELIAVLVGAATAAVLGELTLRFSRAGYVGLYRITATAGIAMLMVTVLLAIRLASRLTPTSIKRTRTWRFERTVLVVATTLIALLVLLPTWLLPQPHAAAPRSMILFVFADFAVLAVISIIAVVYVVIDLAYMLLRRMRLRR